MHATRVLPAVALLLFFPARADESASAKAPVPADAKKADTSMSCCAGEEIQLCPKAKTAKATTKKKPAAKNVPATPEAAAKPVAGTASMVVARDPVTGQLRAPTAEEMRELNALRPQAAPVAPQVVVLPDGTKMIRLGDESMRYVVARRNPDGTLTQVCVEGAEAAAAAAQKPSSPSSTPRKEER